MKHSHFELSGDQTLRLTELRHLLELNVPEGIAETVKFPVAHNAVCIDCQGTCLGTCYVTCGSTCTGGAGCGPTCRDSCLGPYHW
jgi:hypothetical protein